MVLVAVLARSLAGCKRAHRPPPPTPLAPTHPLVLGHALLIDLAGIQHWRRGIDQKDDLLVAGRKVLCLLSGGNGGLEVSRRRPHRCVWRQRDGGGRVQRSSKQGAAPPPPRPAPQTPRGSTRPWRRVLMNAGRANPLQQQREAAAERNARAAAVGGSAASPVQRSDCPAACCWMSRQRCTTGWGRGRHQGEREERVPRGGECAGSADTAWLSLQPVQLCRPHPRAADNAGAPHSTRACPPKFAASRRPPSIRYQLAPASSPSAAQRHRGSHGSRRAEQRVRGAPAGGAAQVGPPPPPARRVHGSGPRLRRPPARQRAPGPAAHVPPPSPRLPRAGPPIWTSARRC